MQSLKYTRFYAGPDGETHFEDVEVPLTDNGRMSQLSEVMAATGIVFRHTDGDYDLDFHNAPRRQFIINLTGQVEIEVSDGEKRRFGPGSIMLADDTTGKGHISRAVGGEERVSIFVHLP